MATFSKNFKNKNQSQGFIPKSILDNLNSKLKNNLEYVYCGDDTYILTSNSDEMEIKIKNFDVENIEEIKDKLGKDNLRMDELLEYAYNAQKKLVLLPRENFEQYINGVLVDNDKFMIGKSTVHLNEGKYFITPSKMDTVAKFLIGSKNNAKEILFYRRPIESLTKVRFSTGNDEKIYIQYIIDKEKGIINFTIKSNDNNIESIDEYIEVNECIRDILVDGLYIENSLINIDKSTQNDLYIDDVKNKINIWKKVKKIEEVLNLKFDIKSFDLDEEGIEDIFVLYKTLVEKKAVKRYEKIENFSYKSDQIEDDTIEDLKKVKGSGIYLEHECTYILNIFKKDYEFYGVIGYFNMYISKIENDKKEKQYNVYMKNYKDKQMYSGMILFQNKDEVNEFKKDTNHVDKLHNAVPIFEEIEGNK